MQGLSGFKHSIAVGMLSLTNSLPHPSLAQLVSATAELAPEPDAEEEEEAEDDEVDLHLAATEGDLQLIEVRAAALPWLPWTRS